MDFRIVDTVHKTENRSLCDPRRPEIDIRAVIIGILVFLVLGVSIWLVHNHTVEANRAASHILIPDTNKK